MCGETPCGECKQKRAMRDALNSNARAKHLIRNMTMAGSLGASKPVSTTPYYGDPSFEVATFVDPLDKLSAWLAVKIYTMRPRQVLNLIYDEELSSSRIGVWKACSTAYVVFRGTQALGPSGVEDIIDDFILASEDTCQLSIAQEGVLAINELYSQGFQDIRLSGHSLGGRAALCAGNQWGVTRVVALNAGAPVISPTNAGPGPSKATHYHIVGDIVSTHLEDTAAKNVRILIGDPQTRVHLATKLPQLHIGNKEQVEKIVGGGYDINWLDTFYHSSDRFLVGDAWRYATPQDEQNSLEIFVFGTGEAIVKFGSYASSLLGFPFESLLKNAVCSNPIPGSNPSLTCKIETSDVKKGYDKLFSFLGGITGALAGLVVMGPGGAVAGFQAGSGIVEGNLIPALEMAIPGYSQLAEGNKLFIQQIVKDIRKRRGDTLDDIIQDVFGKFDKSQLDYYDPMLLT